MSGGDGWHGMGGMSELMQTVLLTAPGPPSTLCLLMPSHTQYPPANAVATAPTHAATPEQTLTCSWRTSRRATHDAYDSSGESLVS